MEDVVDVSIERSVESDSSVRGGVVDGKRVGKSGREEGLRDGFTPGILGG
jgi:hypothetical protein